MITNYKALQIQSNLTQSLPLGSTNGRLDYVGTDGVIIAGSSTEPLGTSESGRTNGNFTTGQVEKLLPERHVSVRS